jgi:hypothetical protein
MKLPSRDRCCWLPTVASRLRAAHASRPPSVWRSGHVRAGFRAFQFASMSTAWLDAQHRALRSYQSPSTMRRRRDRRGESWIAAGDGCGRGSAVDAEARERGLRPRAPADGVTSVTVSNSAGLLQLACSAPCWRRAPARRTPAARPAAAPGIAPASAGRGSARGTAGRRCRRCTAGRRASARTGLPYSMTTAGSGSRRMPARRVVLPSRKSRLPRMKIHRHAGIGQCAQPSATKAPVSRGIVVAHPGLEQVAEDVQRVGAARLALDEAPNSAVIAGRSGSRCRSEMKSVVMRGL